MCLEDKYYTWNEILSFPTWIVLCIKKYILGKHQHKQVENHEIKKQIYVYCKKIFLWEDNFRLVKMYLSILCFSIRSKDLLKYIKVYEDIVLVRTSLV